MAAMNKHTDLEVIKNKAVALPALIKTIFADWKILRLLAEQADHLADEYDKYGRILDEFENYEPTDHETAPSGEYLKLNVNTKKTIARCGAWLDKIERDDLYDTDEHRRPGAEKRSRQRAAGVHAVDAGRRAEQSGSGAADVAATHLRRRAFLSGALERVPRYRGRSQAVGASQSRRIPEGLPRRGKALAPPSRCDLRTRRALRSMR